MKPLSDEAIYEAWKYPQLLNSYKEMTIERFSECYAVAQEAQRDTLRQIYNWGLEGCPHVQQGSLKYTQRRECGLCWKELKEEK